MLNNCTLKFKYNHAVIDCPDKIEYAKLMRQQQALIALLPVHIESVSIKFRKNCTTLIRRELQGGQNPNR
ncbi:MAG: hypothetical protein ACKPCP_34125 [Sphaerospermopsis kisseleviana]